MRIAVLLLLLSVPCTFINGQSYLYRITGPGVEGASYLFGTIHIMPKNKFSMDPKLEEVATKVDLHVYEFNLTTEKIAIQSLPTLTKAMLPGELSMADFLTPAELNALKAYLKDTLQLSYLEMAVLLRMKPLFLGQAILSMLAGDSPVSYETKLQGIARQNKIPVAGLETMDEQFRILDSVSLKDQAAVLKEEIRDLGDLRKKTNEIYDLYLKGDPEALTNYMMETWEMKKYAGLLLWNRNKKWVPEMLLMMNKRSCLFAVGAGHLPGESGLISLLRQRGLQVVQVTQ